MKLKSMLMTALLVIAVGTCVVGCHSRGNEKNKGSAIPLSDVPPAVKDAASKAVAGINLTEAEIEKEKSGTVYELKGEADGKEYEMKVTAEGKVIKTKEGDNEDSDQEEDDDNGDKENNGVITPVADVSRVVRNSAGKADANIILFDAMSPYEDLTEYALVQDKAEVEKTIVSLDELVKKIKGVLTKKAILNLNDNIEKIKIASKNDDFPQIALLAVDSYKTISEELDASMLEVPKEVVILDYVGFKVHALLKQQNVDWDLIAKTVNEGVSQWENIRGKVSDKGLYDVMNTAIAGLKDATKSKNIDMLRFAAQVDLDLVDLLEGFFQNK